MTENGVSLIVFVWLFKSGSAANTIKNLTSDSSYLRGQFTYKEDWDGGVLDDPLDDFCVQLSGLTTDAVQWSCRKQHLDRLATAVCDVQAQHIAVVSELGAQLQSVLPLAMLDSGEVFLVGLDLGEWDDFRVLDDQVGVHSFVHLLILSKSGLQVRLTGGGVHSRCRVGDCNAFINLLISSFSHCCLQSLSSTCQWQSFSSAGDEVKQRVRQEKVNLLGLQVLRDIGGLSSQVAALVLDDFLSNSSD